MSLKEKLTQKKQSNSATDTVLFQRKKWLRPIVFLNQPFTLDQCVHLVKVMNIVVLSQSWILCRKTISIILEPMGMEDQLYLDLIWLFDLMMQHFINGSKFLKKLLCQPSSAQVSPTSFKPLSCLLDPKGVSFMG